MTRIVMENKELKKFTPEVLLSAPRRSAGTPSPDGKLVVFTQSTYSFETHSKTNEICVLDVANTQISCVTKDIKASEPNWLGDGHELVWLRATENGNTNFIIGDASHPGKSYVGGTVPGPVSDLKLFSIEPGMVAVAVAGQATSEGSLFNPKDVQKQHTSARLYDSTFVRHWDHYVDKQRNSIFTGLLKKGESRVTDRPGRFTLLGFQNALHGTNLECPMPPWGGTDHFDIGASGIVVVAKDPELNPAFHTKCGAWFVPKKELMDLSTPKLIRLEHSGFDGAITSPRFSPDGESIALLQMAEDGYEADKCNILVYINATKGDQAIQVRTLRSEKLDAWDASPEALSWTRKGESLLLQVEEEGSGLLYRLDITDPVPFKLTTSGSVEDVKPISATSYLLLVSSSSLIDPSLYSIVNPLLTESPKTLSSSGFHGAAFGLSPSQVDSLHWTGANDHDIHAWVVRPSSFKPSKKYPLAYLIHGGPQGAWLDQWSTRWNPAVYAEQGYVVVCPNPTGSTSYGQKFTDDIKNNWGSSPYEDLARGFDYIRDNVPYIDTDRAVALGASYGGYMMNWMQGHDLGKKFKALVCHDGVFSMSGQLASEEQYFPEHDLGGPLWKRQEMYDKWDPSRFTANWETPMLVIHNDKDYRLTVGEGLAAFNVLQGKGIESRFLNFPDENHWVLNAENSLVWHLVVINWINKFVGLPKYTTKDGMDGNEYLMQPKTKTESG